MSALAQLARRLRSEERLLAGAVREGEPPPSDLGERAAAGREGYATIVEAVREGYELHYGVPRVLGPDDPDLALLAGDRLYALGLADLAERGDVEAVAALADVISECARAHAEGAPEAARESWERGVARLAGHRPEPPPR
jgi:hypothetical protein